MNCPVRSECRPELNSPGAGEHIARTRRRRRRRRRPRFPAPSRLRGYLHRQNARVYAKAPFYGISEHSRSENLAPSRPNFSILSRWLPPMDMSRPILSTKKKTKMRTSVRTETKTCNEKTSRNNSIAEKEKRKETGKERQRKREREGGSVRKKVFLRERAYIVFTPCWQMHSVRFLHSFRRFRFDASETHRLPFSSFFFLFPASLSAQQQLFLVLTYTVIVAGTPCLCGCRCSFRSAPCLSPRSRRTVFPRGFLA